VFRTDIEGLRGIAVLAVVLHHMNASALPHGYLGVDIFFVISGYVITASIASWDWADFAPSAARFFGRRFKRLAPALVVCLVLTTALSSLVIQDMGEYIETGYWAAFGASNIFLYLQQADYFGSSVELNPFTHTWSLGVEEQFYLLFPVLAWLALSPRFGAGTRAGLRWGAILLTLCSLAAFVWGTRDAPNAAFYLLPFRAWELAIGAGVFILNTRLGRTAPPWMPSVAVLLALVACLALPPETDRSVLTSLAVILTALLLWDTRQGGGITLLLANRPIRYFGRISYSLYLWHWPVVVFAKWSVGITAVTAPVLIAIMLALASGSYRFVEQPLRHAQWGARRRTAALKGMSGLVAGLVLLSVFEGVLKERLYLGDPAPLEHRGSESLLIPLADSNGNTWQGAPCVIDTPSRIGQPIRIDQCTFGAFQTAERRVLVLGNSFTAAFSGTFQTIADTEDMSITLTSSWGSPAVPPLDGKYDGPWMNENRYYWADVVPDLVASLRAGDIVFLASDLAYVFSVNGALSQDALTKYTDGVRRLTADLGARGIRLAVLGPMPLVREANCTPDTAVSQWFARQGGPCHYYSRTATLDRLAPLQQAQRELAQDSGVILVDLFDFFCPDAVCNYGSRDTIVLYRDEWSHPSLEAARAVAPDVFRQLTTP
jgi:peptidoglycan/LPS O-acetylase OafA/YrhL